MAQGVWTIAEQRDGEIRKITYEIISEGRRLADALGQDLTVLLLGSNIQPIKGYASTFFSPSFKYSGKLTISS